MSTAYLPESDCQKEVVNRTHQQCLRSFVRTKPSSWHYFLPWAEWCHNTALHLGTGYTPFEIIYGRPPPAIPDYLPGHPQVEAVEHILQARDATLQQQRKNLEKAQARMKKLADEKLRDVEFEVGSWVYVKLKLYRQVSLACHRPQKLAKRYFRPFQVTERIGKVAYKLALPPQAKIHPVFHCSLLKPHHGPAPLAGNGLPENVFYGNPLVKPVVVLATKLDSTVVPPVRLVLAQWKVFP